MSLQADAFYWYCYLASWLLHGFLTQAFAFKIVELVQFPSSNTGVRSPPQLLCPLTLSGFCQLLTHRQLQLRSWSLWLCPIPRMTWPAPENMWWRRFTWEGPMGYDGKDFLKQKILQEKVRTVRPLVCLVLVLRLAAGSFQPGKAHLWLLYSSVKPYQSHKYYLSPRTGPEGEVKILPSVGLGKVGFANRSLWLWNRTLLPTRNLGTPKIQIPNAILEPAS